MTLNREESCSRYQCFEVHLGLVMENGLPSQEVSVTTDVLEGDEKEDVGSIMCDGPL